MDELETRFQTLNELVMPDLWLEAEGRAASPDRRREEQPHGPRRLLDGPRRLLVVVMALSMTGGSSPAPCDRSCAIKTSAWSIGLWSARKYW